MKSRELLNRESRRSVFREARPVQTVDHSELELRTEVCGRLSESFGTKIGQKVRFTSRKHEGRQ